MTFWKTVRAYLTGWLIVQPIYNRLYNLWVRQQWVNPSPALATHMRFQARLIVDEMERRGWAVKTPTVLSPMDAEWAIVARPKPGGSRLVGEVDRRISLERGGYEHLPVDGALYLREEYPELAAALRDMFGTDGDAKFRVPDFRVKVRP